MSSASPSKSPMLLPASIILSASTVALLANYPLNLNMAMDIVSSNHWVRDSVAGVGTVVCSRVWVKIWEVLVERGLITRVLSRKLVHASTGPLFGVFWLLYSSDPSARFFASIVPLLNGLRLTLLGTGIIKDTKAVQSVSRDGNPKELLQGPLYYCVVLALTPIIFWRGSPASFVALSMLCGGDGFADIVGRRYGAGRKWSFNPDKSWPGSLAMFITGLIMSAGFLFLYSSLGFFSIPDMPALLLRLSFISAVGTAVEALPVKTLDDNWTVPLVTAILTVALL